jgi:hypothetical protein
MFDNAAYTNLNVPYMWGELSTIEFIRIPLLARHKSIAVPQTGRIAACEITRFMHSKLSTIKPKFDQP